MNMPVPVVDARRSPPLPMPAPLAMPVRDLDVQGAPGSGLVSLPLLQRRLMVAALTFLAIAGLCTLMVQGLLSDGLQGGDAVLLALYVPNIVWTAFAAATAVCGVFWYQAASPNPAPPPNWMPLRKTAVLVPVRNEDVDAVGERIASLCADLGRAGLRRAADVFILSDSDHPASIAAEEALALRFARRNDPVPRVYYRRRVSNEQRKPGNISDWVRRWGGAYAYMLVLDADSRMSAKRIAGMIHRMEMQPNIGLIQTGVKLTGARSRFARLQQLATRLYGAAFASGIAGWSGTEGNYWGHNALIRVRAFAGAAGLPRLRGRSPFGGDILSHDFIEAAWLRRAGWAVEIDPDSRGSAEGGPETLDAYHKRDRRWCQGNLQHLRIVLSPGLHPVSRLHLLSGIFGYLAAPMWLAFVVGATVVGPSGALLVPAIGAVMLILTQKLAGVAVWIRRRPRMAGKILRLAAIELGASMMLAPVIMVRQTIAVASVFAGHDCGWKPPVSIRRRSTRGGDQMAWIEPTIGLGLLLVALPAMTSVWQFALMAPIAVPLLLAPHFVEWLDLQGGQTPASWKHSLVAPSPRIASRRRTVA